MSAYSVKEYNKPVAIYSKKVTFAGKVLIAFIVRGGAAVARRAHNPKVAGSTPAPATIYMVVTSFTKKSPEDLGAYTVFIRWIHLLFSHSGGYDSLCSKRIVRDY